MIAASFSEFSNGLQMYLNKVEENNETLLYPMVLVW
jgi:hypothetical protein